MFRLSHAAAILLAIGLSGCATAPPRVLYTASDLAVASPIEGDPIRFWASNDDAKYQKWGASMAAQRQAASLPLPKTLLALSGGSDKGAFSAGLLNAWSRRGDRPTFDIVTGVSTGSLIAPFAFLGTSEDADIKTIYTSVSQKDIYRERVLSGLFGGSSLFDTGPLQSLIARYITPEFIDRVAAEHRRGRRLLVMTTNLDAQRGVIWDMGAIAASGSPRRVTLFRQVLLASSSIPGVFPPVLIDVTGDGKKFAEMHIDGGAVGGFFLLPRAMLASSPPQPKGDNGIYVLYNGRLSPEFDVVQPRTFAILSSALSTVLGEVDRTSIDNFRAFARDRNLAFMVCSIENEKNKDITALFDTAHMRELYALGEQAVGVTGGCLPPAKH